MKPRESAIPTLAWQLRFKRNSAGREQNRLEGAKMPGLRSTLDPEEQPDFIEGPTRYKVGANQSELVCGVCGGTYYVDDATLEHAIGAMEKGFDNPFCCEECEADYELLSHEGQS